MASMRQISVQCSGHTRPVVDLAFSKITPSGFYLISACKDGKPMLRQGDTGDWIGTFSGHKGAVWGVALNDDASRAASGAADFTAKVWDAVSGEELYSFTHQHIVKSVDFSKDSKHLLTGSNEKILRIYDLNQKEAESITFSGHTSNIKRCLFIEDDNKVVSAADDKTVRFWDRANGKEVFKLDFAAVPSDLEVTTDGKLLVIPYGRVISFWDLKTYEKVKEYEIPTKVNTASMHPNNDTFICGGDDFKMYKFEYNSGIELESFKGHFGPVHCARFSPDGEIYASGSEDGTLRLWQTTVGKTYGLWKCVSAGDAVLNDITNNHTVKSES
ncbi:hypothetical protein CHUAL_005375 [Chamberlinius hualienensis]